MPVKQLKQCLEKHGVAYTCLTHPPAFTAQELAHHAKITGDQAVKTVILELDGNMAMLVMPATRRIRWDRLCDILDTDFVQLADEDEFRDRFPQCEVGAMPPFGNLYGMTVYCCEALTLQEEIAFAAGSHTESIRMRTEDFLALVHPMVIREGFSRPGQARPAWMRKAS
ncbi:Ala-tRNA(Pro) deacylase [Tamilnaduibacter salinus]|uniref:Deacylase n=1 Tax=Tamilnaduibacter salinus TaxID=1484056 RepID=A0A2A2I3K9_9GAMM|nr:YbaK/EbsC family protein [Tamilnaduibacter salinus]PAV25988.1 deacylase [Tamilnaduibacter salinus]PVY76311.1 Ala-tRNA(Pro) deacylase [Tamilnaduibacter salinus]